MTTRTTLSPLPPRRFLRKGPHVPLSVHWFLPTAGDSRDVVGFGPTSVRRDADLGYLTQVARAADDMGFDAVLTPTGTWCEDAWIATAALIPRRGTSASWWP